MDATDLRQAFIALGTLCDKPVEIVLAGGAAMVLVGYMQRGTVDADAVAATPSISDLTEAIARVADDLGLPRHWLNDNVQRYADILPDDYRARCVLVGTFGPLTVWSLGRSDTILMKLMALRGQDMDDLDVLKPSSEELAFVLTHLPRLADRYRDRVIRIRYYLQGPGVRPLDSGPYGEATSPIRRSRHEE